MRYYKIEISDDNGKVLRAWTSYANGQTDPNAMDIEIDLPVAPFATPMGGDSGSHVRIWGISLQDIGQASDFNGKRISVSGGMQKGLPLANPRQSALLTSGRIFQAFGNWIGIDQTLEFLVVPETGGKDLGVNWAKGTKMADAINQTLKTAFPDYTLDIKISDSLVFAQDIPAHYSSLTTFAQWVQLTSASILNPNSDDISRAGVDIIVRDKTFIVRDDTTPRQPREISFVDLIGQPTWYAPSQVSVNVVMRGDIAVLDYIKLPQTLNTTLPESKSQARNGAVFQGVFKVNKVRHVGRFRYPSADAWITSLFVSAVPKNTGQVTVSDAGG